MNQEQTSATSRATADQRRLALERLRRDAELLAHEFDLRLQRLQPESPRVRRRYGICFEDGEIRIRLTHARTGRMLKYSALVDTLCHELAHLRHFNHGRRFQALYRRILARARRRGIYQPDPLGSPVRVQRPTAQSPAAPRTPRAAIQLDLFR